MSVGRRICHKLVDTAADLRWYAAALTEANEDLAAAADCLEIASRVETLIARWGDRVTTTATKPLLRWSSVRSCPRKAVYEWQGAPARERTTEEEGHLWRGKSVGRDYTLFLATQQQVKVWVDSGHDYWLPPDLRASDRESAGLIAETKIEWPVGIGHADIYIPETKTIVEILSSASASDAMIRSKQLQCVGYVLHHPDAENGALVIVNPSNLTTERIVMMPTSAQYAELVQEVGDRIAQLKVWEQTGELPARVCEKPSDARQHFCQHAAHCFDGWEPPPLEQIAAGEDLIEAARELAEAKRVLSEMTYTEKEYEQRRKAAQAILEAAELPAGVDVQVGPYVVRRAAVERKPTFAWEKAELAGVFEPGLYGDYFKPGASYSTYRAERVDVSGDEYGEDVPF